MVGLKPVALEQEARILPIVQTEGLTYGGFCCGCTRPYGGNTMLRPCKILILLGALSGCVTGPLLGEEIEDPRAPISFSVWTLQQGDVSVVWCKPFGTSVSFSEIGRITSGSFRVSNEGDTVYRGLGSFVVPEVCWRSFHTTFAAELKVTPPDGSRNYFTYDNFGLDCLVSKYFDGVSPFDAGIDCQPSYNRGQIILLHEADVPPGSCAPDGTCPLP